MFKIKQWNNFITVATAISMVYKDIINKLLLIIYRLSTYWEMAKTLQLFYLDERENPVYII
jgi:hypothetical protein